MTVEVFFLPRPVGQRLCIYHPPHALPPEAALVYVHPLAEEMNKSRRMAALQSRALAKAGCAVLQIDLLGCGDSTGDLADATWELWIDDILGAARWLRGRCDAPLWLWGLRAGGLLATASLARLDIPAHLLLWQPMLNGRLALQQLLRLKLAAHLSDGTGPEAMREMRSLLAAGQTVDVAGYPLTAALAADLERARLDPPRGCATAAWFEVSSRIETPLSPASAQAQAAWRAAGWAIRSHRVTGAAFWQTTEIEDAPNLIDATTAVIARSGTPASP